MAKKKDTNESTTDGWFAYDASKESVREATGNKKEWDAMKVVIRAVNGANWYDDVPKGRANRVALFNAIQEEVDSPLIGQFSSLKVASEKGNLGVHVTKPKASPKGKATGKKAPNAKAASIPEPTMAELMAMIVAMQAKQD